MSLAHCEHAAMASQERGVCVCVRVRLANRQIEGRDQTKTNSVSDVKLVKTQSLKPLNPLYCCGHTHTHTHTITMVLKVPAIGATWVGGGCQPYL